MCVNRAECTGYRMLRVSSPESWKTGFFLTKRSTKVTLVQPACHAVLPLELLHIQGVKNSIFEKLHSWTLLSWLSNCRGESRGDRGVASDNRHLSGWEGSGYCVSTAVSTQGTQLAVRAICRTAMWINTAGSTEDTLPSLLWPTLTRNTIGTPPLALMRRLAIRQWSTLQKCF